LCQLPQTKHLKLDANGIYVLSHSNTIKIDDEFFVRQTSINFDEKKAVTECSIEIFSYTSDLLNLKDYLCDLVHKFNLHKNNQLGQTIYYFDEIPTSLPRFIDNSLNYDVAPKNMTFTMSKLCTNKSLENIYGKAMDIVRKRVKFFMTNKKWYQDKGIPYTLGILLYGEPGCGKTSLIKALSKDCQRHVFNIKLSGSTTVSQINNLFFSERVHTVVEGVSSAYNIPIDKRIIVLEDIDCLSDIVLDRNVTQVSSMREVPLPKVQPVKHNPKIDPFANFGDNNSMQFMHFMSSDTTDSTLPNEMLPPIHHTQKLTLSYLLNVLDGVLETPGRIIIMTSNHPDKLDKALIRPGRIDLKVHFEKCSRDDVLEMINKITGSRITTTDIINVPEFKWTPAEVTQKIFENINEDISVIIDTLSDNKLGCRAGNLKAQFNIIK
jgi:Cdc6-like AAA superfamily ATPase